MFTFFLTVQAADIGESFKLGEGGPSINAFDTLSKFLFPLVKNAFVVSGILLFVFLIFGGITFIMNAGSGDKEGMEKGKNALTSAILGFSIIFAAYWLVKIVEFITGIDILNAKK